MKGHALRVANLKKELRTQYKQKRQELSGDIRAMRDGALCTHAVGLASFRYADYILMYAPMKNEINVFPIAEEALHRGKKILFPRCDTSTHTMTYCFVSSLDELSPDAYGILAPPENALAYDTCDPSTALCLIPGLIYDRYGYRVGYGGGYYDRFLTDFKGCKAGIIYSDFIVSEVPRGYFDYKVDIMLTEKNVRIPLEG